MTWRDMCEFRSSFFGDDSPDSQPSTCANLIFFSTKKTPKIQNPKVPRWRPFYGLRCGSQRDLRRHFGAQWRAECCSGSGKRTEVGKLIRSVQTNRLGKLFKKGSFLLEKEPKNVTKQPIFGVSYLNFWRIFSMWAVKKGQFFIGYWLSLSCFWRVNITRNRWVQWNVTYIFFTGWCGCESAWSCLQGWLGGLGQGGWFFSNVDFHTNPGCGGISTVCLSDFLLPAGRPTLRTLSKVVVK